MSSTSSALPGRLAGRRPRGPAARAEQARGLPPRVRLVAFGLLALYGALRWGTLMSAPPTGRLLALVLVAFALATLGPPLAARSVPLAVLAAILAALAMLALAGLPVSWIRHVRIAVTARHVGRGLSALPRLLVPYKGANVWVRTVMMLGAAVLLFDAAVMMAFAMRVPEPQSAGESARSGDLRRAVAALPLIALAAVPLTLVPARFQYMQGAIMFALLAALVWGERLSRHGSGTAVLVCGVAAMVAMIAAPAIDAHKPWIQYQTLTNGIGAGVGENFSWSQGYGPLNWPRTGREVLEVTASRGDYWKAVNLDAVTPTGWIAGSSSTSDGSPVLTRSLSTWLQTIIVSVEELKTNDFIGPGELQQPEHSTQVAFRGNSAGRWLPVQTMGFGDSYTVTAYSPDPTPAQLRRAGTSYPATVDPTYLYLDVPVAGEPPGAALAWVDPFGEPGTVLVHGTYGSGDATPLLTADPGYAGAYRLASRLRAHARTPYDYMMSVLNYLRHGFTYEENVPVSRYPLATFLFKTHKGYCQQFAGAMALLLRLGGVPARVAAGFTTGTYNSGLRRWIVTDFDAHAWVEAYFPGYGWVRTPDPTPASSDPAQQRINRLGTPAGNLTGGRSGAPTLKPGSAHGLGTLNDRRGAAGQRGGSGSSFDVIVPAGIAAVVVLLLAASLLRHMLIANDADTLLSELERAFIRTGRPLVPQFTLAQLEHRMDGVPEAQAYVRRLAQARYAGEDAPGPLPTAAQRRALRAYLRSGLGFSGAVRAFWALPPLLSQLIRPIKRVTGQ